MEMCTHTYTHTLSRPLTLSHRHVYIYTININTHIYNTKTHSHKLYTGVAYQDLVKYLKEEGGKYSVYQPYNVINPIQSTIMVASGASVSGGNSTSLFKSLDTLLAAIDSTR
jgi:hypothetical protein